jgi:hypothetical protein
MSIGDWEPFWLGPPSHRLYAAFHPAPGEGVPSTAVLLVPPLLHELPRSRRFLAEVAGELAGLGVPCLRFDFFGSGDSDGDGERLDFNSMQHDLELATAALRQRTGARRLALLAWRAGALPLHAWIARGGMADLVVLWEPILDGDAWLQELMVGDADERALRPPPRAGIARLTDPGDGQLMGFPASQRLRLDLAQARMASAATSTWAVARTGHADLPSDIARWLPLPAGAPGFAGGAAMEATLFVTPPVRELIGDLGHALRSEAWA